MSVQLRWMLVAGLAAFAVLAVACGSEPNAAPASGSGASVATPAPSILSELDALRIALEFKDGMRSRMEGEPSGVWGATMTKLRAHELIGSPLHPDTSSYDHRNDLVWYFVFEGLVIYEGPGSSQDLTTGPGTVGTMINAFTGSVTGIGSSSQTYRDIGQSQIPKIEVPSNIYDIALPTVVPAPPAPAVTAAPPATPAPPAPTATTGPLATQAPVTLAAPGTFENALRYVPNQPQHTGLIRINDLRGIRRLLELGAPSPNDGDEELLDYKLALLLAETLEGRPYLLGDDWLSGFSPDYMNSAPSTRPYFGFDTRDLDMTVVTGETAGGLSQGIEVVLGDIVSRVARDLIAECETCVPHDLVSSGDLEFYSWGEDGRPSLSDRLAPPAHDQFGRGGRILIDDRFAVRTLFTDQMHDAISAISDPERSVLVEEDFALAARAADDLGVVSLTLTSQPFKAADIIEVFAGRGRLTTEGLDPEYEGLYASGNPNFLSAITREELVRDGFAQSGSLPAFRLVATGLGHDDKGMFVTLALVFESDDVANDAAQALESRIESGVYPSFSIEAPELKTWDEQIKSYEVDVTGRTVTARLRVTDPSRVQQNFILRGNGPFSDAGIGVGTLTLFLITHD